MTVKTVVHCPVPPPVWLQGERFAGMDTICELFEINAGQGVPVAVAVGPADVFRQIVQNVDVLFVDVLVIVDRSLDEHIVVGVLLSTELAVYKQAFHPEVTDTTGVTGKVHTLRQSVVATDDCVKAAELGFQELCRFVDEQHVPVVTLELTLDGGRVVRHVGEFDLAAVDEGQKVVCLVVGVSARLEQLQHGLDNRVFQLVILTADYQDLNARVVERQQHSLADDCPALSAASGAAVAGVSDFAEEEFPLRV